MAKDILNKKTVFLFLITVTAFSIVVYPGYQVFANDQSVYVPQMMKNMDGSLFLNDFSLSFAQTDYTLYDDLIIYFIEDWHIGIFVLFFILTLVCRFIFFYSVYKLAWYFTRHKLFSLFSVLLFIVPFGVYGASISTLEIELHPRLISLALCLLSLTLYLGNRRLWSTLPLGIALVVHPMMTAPFIAIFYACLLRELKSGWLKLNADFLYLAAMPMLWLSVLLVSAERSALGLLTIIDDEWDEIIRYRTDYIYVSAWGEIAWSYLAISLLSLIVIFTELTDAIADVAKKYLYLFISVPIILSGLSFILADILHLQIFAGLQMARSLILLKMLVIILFSYYALRKIYEAPTDYLLNFFLLGILIAGLFNEALVFLFFPSFFLWWGIEKYYHRFMLKRNYLRAALLISIFIVLNFIFIYFEAFSLRLNFNNLMLLYADFLVLLLSLVIFAANKYKISISDHARKGYIGFTAGALFFTLLFLPGCTIYPAYAQDQNFNDLCDWIKNNTGINEMFITAPFSGLSAEIRLLCQRGVYVTRGDSSQAIFNREYGIEWSRRYQLFTMLENNGNNLRSVMKKEKIDYIVSENVLSDFKPLYNNEKYYVYGLLPAEI